MPKLKILMIALATMGYAAAAHADGTTGAACAAKLSADGKAIYTATMAAKPTMETARTTLEKEARGLAMSDKIGRGSARENATEAGECVKATLQ
jgi:hypothetical protein